MSIKSAAIEHTLNVIRRDIHAEYPDLTVLFVLFEPGMAAEALARKRDEILHHPAGADLCPALEASLPTDPKTGFLAGLSHCTESHYFGLAKKLQILAVAFVNKSEIDDEEQAAFSARYLALRLTYQVLDIYRKFHDKSSGLHSEGPLIRFSYTPSEWLRAQMLSDCFATMTLETLGEKNAIQRIIKRRCEMTITPIADEWPEHHPFPLALDATVLVYKDLRDAAPQKTGPLAHCFFMTQEIGQTYEDVALMQWVTFCKAAQEMAWTGATKTEILGAAVYSVEDAYIRSTAYIIAETLNTDPLPLKNTEIYNPFADELHNERLHMKKARLLFMDIIEQAAIEDEFPLKRAIKTTNAELLDGNPLGWCAPAMTKALEAYRQHASDNTLAAEMATKTFYETFERTTWKEISKLHGLIMQKRRTTGQKPDLEFARIASDNDPELSYLSYAFVAQT